MGKTATTAKPSLSMDQLKDIISSAVNKAVEPMVNTQTSWQKTLTVPAQVAVKDAPGTSFATFTRALAAAKGNKELAAQVAGNTYNNDFVAKQLLATVNSAGGFLVPDAISSEIIEILRAESVVRSMGPRILPMPSGNLTMNGGASGAVASYVAEGVNSNVTQPSFRQINLSARKLMAIVPVSNDLLRFASPDADTFVRNDLVAALSERQDLAFIRGDGSGNTPKGFRNLCIAANVIAANVTVNLANISQDLGKLDLALLNANIRMRRPGYLVAPRTFVFLQNLRDGNGNKAFPEMDQGKLRGYPIAKTTQIPTNLGSGSDSEVYFVDFDNVVIGDSQQITIDISSDAAYIDGATTVSTFQRDETVIRAIQQHDIDVRQDATIAVLTGVNWQ